MARYDNSAMQDELVSKTQQKRAMLELQALGVALVELPQAQLSDMRLPAALAAAVAEARRMTRHEAKRRQLQFIGKLMRSIDAEPIREQLAASRSRPRRSIAGSRIGAADCSPTTTRSPPLPRNFRRPICRRCAPRSATRARNRPRRSRRAPIGNCSASCARRVRPD